MAGDWIPRCKGLNRKPEVLAIARATGMTRHTVADLLMDFWEWADSETDNGLLPNLTIAELSQAIPGTDERFWLAVVQAGWLLVGNTGLTIPNFDRWLGRSAKKRLQKNRRQSDWRASAADVDAGASTEAPTTEQYSTEEEPKGSSPPDKPAARELFDGDPEVPCDSHRQAPSGSKPTGNSRKRARNPLWDAVVAVTESDPKTSRTNIGRVCSCLCEAEPPYTPTEVLALPAILQARGFSLPLTLGTVEKYIGWTREQPKPKEVPNATQPRGSVGSGSRVRAEPGKYDAIIARGKRAGEAGPEQGAAPEAPAAPQADAGRNPPGASPGDSQAGGG